MKVLVVKLSSLGDVIHTLPAISDAAVARPGIQFDWVVEEAFTEVPDWHPAVVRVIPTALRRWRRHPLRALRGGQWRKFLAALGEQRYDLIVDAQGLYKSACVARLARGAVCGMDRHSAREPLAAFAYQHKVSVPRGQHAVERLRQLFALALDYPAPRDPGAFDIADSLPAATAPANRLVFLHGSARAEKLWPLAHWVELARRAVAQGWSVVLPWGNPSERSRAQAICDQAGQGVTVSSTTTLAGLGQTLASARGFVAVDTGPAHLAAALGTPGVTLYGPTLPERVGTYGSRQVHLRARAQRAGEMALIKPLPVWRALHALLTDGNIVQGGVGSLRS